MFSNSVQRGDSSIAHHPGTWRPAPGRSCPWGTVSASPCPPAGKPAELVRTSWGSHKLEKSAWTMTTSDDHKLRPQVFIKSDDHEGWPRVMTTRGDHVWGQEWWLDKLLVEWWLVEWREWWRWVMTAITTTSPDLSQLFLYCTQSRIDFHLRKWGFRRHFS